MKLVTGIALGLGFLMITGCGTSSRSGTFVGNDSRSPVKENSANKESRKKRLFGDLFQSAPEAGSEPGVRTTQMPRGGNVISELYSTADCAAISRGGFIWLTDRVVLADLLSPLGATAADSVLAKVNFDTHGALMVDFGVMPTPDFNVKLMSDQLRIDGAKAVINVDLVKPAETRVRNAQIVKHPCALYVLPRTGYSTLEVQSDLGDVFTTFAN